MRLAFALLIVVVAGFATYGAIDHTAAREPIQATAHGLFAAVLALVAAHFMVT